MMTTITKRKRKNEGTFSNTYTIVHKRPKLQISLSSSARTLICSLSGSATIANGAASSVENNSCDFPPQSSKNSDTVPEEECFETEEIVQPKTTDKILIIGKFEVLHVTDDEEEPTLIVKNLVTNDFALCREITNEKYQRYLLIRQRLNKFSSSESDDKIEQNVWPSGTELFKCDSEKKFYIVFPRHYGTLHNYVIDKKKLSEEETLLFYRQVLHIVMFCHERGIVVRDLKLRKFVFIDEQRCQIRLDDLDEVNVCDHFDDDSMSGRHGCPAYVSPEILDLSQKYYSGKSADMWSLGVLLYVMLMGRYPFYDETPSGLFAKICSAKVFMNDQCGISLEVRWLIRCLIRKLPEERPKIQELLAHPWFNRNRLKFNSGTVGDIKVPLLSAPRSLSLSLVDDPFAISSVPRVPSVSMITQNQNIEIDDQRLDFY